MPGQLGSTVTLWFLRSVMTVGLPKDFMIKKMTGQKPREFISLSPRAKTTPPHAIVGQDSADSQPEGGRVLQRNESQVSPCQVTFTMRCLHSDGKRESHHLFSPPGTSGCYLLLLCNFSTQIIAPHGTTGCVCLGCPDFFSFNLAGSPASAGSHF